MKTQNAWLMLFVLTFQYVAQLSEVSAQQQVPCANVLVGIKSTKQLLRKSQLKCFTSSKMAKSSGFIKFGVTPSFSIEEGNRIDTLTSSTTILLSDNTYRTYLPGIRTATSVDGLTWSTPQSVTGLTSDTTTFGNNTAALLKSDGSILLIYEKAPNMQSDGTGPHVFYRATSQDGINFSDATGAPVLTPESDEKNFVSVPEIIKLKSGKLRLYFVAGGDNIESAVSADDGLSWTREGPIKLQGIDTRQQVDPDIIAIPGGFRLFFATQGNKETGNLMNLRIRTATSVNGKNFKVESGDRIGVENTSQVRLDPDVVLMPNGKYRIYFGEATSNQANDFNLRSAVSTD